MVSASLDIAFSFSSPPRCAYRSCCRRARNAVSKDCPLNGPPQRSPWRSSDRAFTLAQRSSNARTDMTDQIEIEKVIARNQEYVRKNPPPAATAQDTIATTGILHFTIGVRDHIAAAKFYSEVL